MFPEMARLLPPNIVLRIKTTFQQFKPRFSAVSQILLSAEGCGCLADRLRFECGKGFFAVFAVYSELDMDCIHPPPPK